MSDPNDRTNIDANNHPDAGDTDGEILDDNDEGSSADEGDADSNVADGDDADGDAADGDADNGETDDGTDVNEGIDGGGGVDANPRRSRGKNQFAQLRERAQRAEQDRLELQRQLDQARAGQTRQQQEQKQREYDSWVATLTPEERAEERGRQIEQRTNQRLNQMGFVMADNADKQGYQTLARNMPIYAKYAERVEQFLAGERRQGRDLKREVIAQFLIGQDAVKKAQNTGTRRANKAAANVARETVRPSAGRSEGVGRGGKTGSGDNRAARAKRLDGVQL